MSFTESCAHARDALLNGPGNFLRFVDQKIGIEVFKLGIVLSTVYFVQGMGGLSSIPLLFYFKDILHFTEAQVQYFSAITGVAWLIKPLFGYISDRWPIFGYRRKSYMIMNAVVASCAWFALAMMVSKGVSQYAALVLVFNLSSLGYAFVDVVCDGLMVQRGQELNAKMMAEGKNPDKLKNLVNLQWFAIGISGFIAGLAGGSMQAAIKAGTLSLSFVFILSGIVPLLTATIAWLCVNEEKVLRGSYKKECAEHRASGGKSVFRELLTSRMFWSLTAFLFFWHYSPSFGAVASYYNIDILSFDEKFLGLLSAVGNALFPLSIILYYGFLKWFPKIRTKTYLYASIAISMVYYGISYLFYLPAVQLEWVRFTLPGGVNILVYWAMPLAVLTVACWWFFRRLRNRTQEPGDNRSARAWFVLACAFVVPLSMVLAAWFSDVSFAPFVLSYRTLAVVNNVVFGYLMIAAFLIPLSLAGELAPSKGEAMTYAYFMALINVSKSFIPDISGAKMFEILKEMLTKPSMLMLETPLRSFLIAGVALMVLCIFVLLVMRMLRGKMRRCDVIGYIVAGLFGLGLIGFENIWWHFGEAGTWLVQQSFILIKPIIGSAAWLGKDEYRCLILRYSVIVGAIFTLISTFFVYILRIPNKESKGDVSSK